MLFRATVIAAMLNLKKQQEEWMSKQKIQPDFFPLFETMSLYIATDDNQSAYVTYNGIVWMLYIPTTSTQDPPKGWIIYARSPMYTVYRTE